MRLTTLLFVSALSSLGHISRAFPLKPQAPPNQPAVRRRVAYSVVAVNGGSAATPPAVSVPDTLILIQTSDSTVTVTAPASTMPPSIEMIVATNVVSELEPTKTVDITVTQELTKTPSPTAIPSYIIINPPETLTSSSMIFLPSQTHTSVPIMKSANSFSTSTATPILSSNVSSISIWTSIPTTLMPLESSHRASEAAPQAEEKRPESAIPEAALQIPSPLPPPPPPPTPSPTITNSSTRPTASSKKYDSGKWHTSYPVWNMTSTVFSSASTTVIGTGRAQHLWKKG